MITQAYVENYEAYAQRYVEKLRAMKDEDAKEYARKHLYDMGLLDENMQPKKQIVTGDFFGW